MSGLSGINLHIQRVLFPALEEEFGPLTENEQRFVRVLGLVDVASQTSGLQWCGVGRKPHSRAALARAFIAKAVWGFPTTRLLIDYLKANANLRRLCGWECASAIPHESVFSRAFARFALQELPANLHRDLVVEHVGNHLFGHLSRDATAIKAREKPAQRPKPEPEPPVKRGRPAKGEKRPARKKRRIERQPGRSLKKNLKDLPRPCDRGTKINSKNRREHWTGYKLHLDVADGDIPVSAILTSASIHDSQVAVPLAQMSAQRVTNLYDLMDAGYDAKVIHAFSRRLGHVPIIDHQPGYRRPKVPMVPPDKERYRERSSAERVNANLKDNYGGRHVRVQGNRKVACHLMFGLVALTALQLYGLVT